MWFKALIYNSTAGLGGQTVGTGSPVVDVATVYPTGRVLRACGWDGAAGEVIVEWSGPTVPDWVAFSDAAAAKAHYLAVKGYAASDGEIN